MPFCEGLKVWSIWHV